MAYSPIVVFGFNRLDALRNTITSLLQNMEAKANEAKIKSQDYNLEKIGKCWENLFSDLLKNE